MFIVGTSLKSSSVPSKPPELDESEHGYTWSHGTFPFKVQNYSNQCLYISEVLDRQIDSCFVLSDYLLYACATVLLVGVVVLMPLAVVVKIW